MNIIIPKMTEKTIELPGRKEVLKGILAVLLSGASWGSATPVGLVYAATMGTESVYIPMIALAVSTILGKNFTLKYICGFFLFRLLVYLRKKDDINVKAVALGFSLLFTGAVELLFLRGGILDIAFLFAECFAAGLCYLLFTKMEEKSGVGATAVLVVAGAVFNGLTGIIVPRINVNLGVFFSLFAVICMCYSYNLPTAVFGGSIMGLLVNINSVNPVEAMGIYALASVMGAIMSAMGKAGVCTGFLCGVTVCILSHGNFRVLGLYDIIASVGIFALLPEAVHYRIFEAMNRVMEKENASDASNKKIAHQLKNIASAMKNLADGITELPQTQKDNKALLVVFDSVASRVCRGCSLEGNCWKKDSKKTYSNMYALWNVIEEDGVCDYGNMPLAFRQVCMRCESFLSEFNHAYELYKQNCLYQGEAITGRGIVARQYGEISNVINVLSHQVEAGNEEDDACVVRFRPQITFRQEPKRGQAISGDVLIHFEKRGKYYVILCDGMGHGETAFSESRLTARLFSEFLKAGFRKEIAVNMINSTLALKADKESFSTVDLLEFDMETGVCEFLKIGSAQSFLRTKSNIEEISSKALPVGILESIEVEIQERELKNNDVVLMVSDGISEAGDGVMKNEWIKKMMLLENRSDAEILHLIIEGARARSRTSDDMTGVIMRIKKVKGDMI